MFTTFTMRARLAMRLKAWCSDDSGSALMEAALVFPLLFVLFFGVSELSEGFIARRKVEVAAFSAADLVARLQAVNSTDLIGLKSIIDETIKPFPVASVGLVVTSVVANESTVTVAWSEALGSGVLAHATGSPPPLPDGLPVPNTSIIVAEVTFTFQSTLSTFIVGGVPLRAQAYQQPRFALQVVRSN